jgi:hypothetical protein
MLRSTMSTSTLRILKLPASARVAVPFTPANFSTAACLGKDPRLADLGKVLKDEYSVIRDEYGALHSFLIPFRIDVAHRPSPFPWASNLIQKS